MREVCFEIRENAALTDRVFRLRLAGDSSAVRGPGQFVSLSLPGFFLRRPFSVCDCTDGELTLVYQLAGRGTEALSSMRSGKLSVLTGLGNGFDLSRAGDAPLLIGGGLGLTPLYYLARRLRERNLPVTAVLGFNTASEVFAAEDFERLGCRVTVTTADGSAGVRGFVTDALPEHYSTFYCCGPEPMLRAVCRATVTSGQLSFEERMGCGFGACMGCSCQTITGSKRICREGPVLEKEEILWDD